MKLYSFEGWQLCEINDGIIRLLHNETIQVIAKKSNEYLLVFHLEEDEK